MWQITVTCDKYDVQEEIGPYLRCFVPWLRENGDDIPHEFGKDFGARELFIAYTFGFGSMFEQIFIDFIFDMYMEEARYKIPGTRKFRRVEEARYGMDPVSKFMLASRVVGRSSSQVLPLKFVRYHNEHCNMLLSSTIE